MGSSDYHYLLETSMHKAKRIRVFENGKIDGGKIVCIHPRKLRTWNALLKHITFILNPSFGAVCHLKTLDGLTSVKSLDEIETGARYVALGSNRAFKNLQYRTISEAKIKRKSYKHYKNIGHNTTGGYWTLEEAFKNKRTIIYVFVNGITDQPPVKFVFTESDFKHWKTSLRYMSSLLDIPEGVFKIYTLNGKQVITPCEFQHGCCYVAASYGDKFISLPYMAIFEHYLHIRKKDNNENYDNKFDLTLMGSPVGNFTNINCPKRRRRRSSSLLQSTYLRDKVLTTLYEASANDETQLLDKSKSNSMINDVSITKTPNPDADINSNSSKTNSNEMKLIPQFNDILLPSDSHESNDKLPNLKEDLKESMSYTPKLKVSIQKDFIDLDENYSEEKLVRDISIIKFKRRSSTDNDGHKKSEKTDVPNVSNHIDLSTEYIEDTQPSERPKGIKTKMLQNWTFEGNPMDLKTILEENTAENNQVLDDILHEFTTENQEPNEMTDESLDNIQNIVEDCVTQSLEHVEIPETTSQ